MVDDYRLERAAQLELAEGLYGQDEDYEVVTFKDWLRAFQWEREPDPPIDMPSQRSSWTKDDDRAEQLRAWHHADSQAVDTLHAARTSDRWTSC
ncbi:hypothetical protein BJF90_31985 [Pseudonocardia sp. CNS-004]|nr:hypothetical protein BJF90_31985 [Pseudonocardia sp. CNS-004]